MLINNQVTTEEIKEKIKKTPRNRWQWKHDNPKPMGCSKNNSTILPQEKENKISIKHAV